MPLLLFVVPPNHTSYNSPPSGHEVMNGNVHRIAAL